MERSDIEFVDSYNQVKYIWRNFFFRHWVADSAALWFLRKETREKMKHPYLTEFLLKRIYWSSYKGRALAKVIVLYKLRTIDDISGFLNQLLYLNKLRDVVVPAQSEEIPCQATWGANLSPKKGHGIWMKSML